MFGCLKYIRYFCALKEQYMHMYQFDYKKACCSASDFEFEKLN